MSSRAGLVTTTESYCGKRTLDVLAAGAACAVFAPGAAQTGASRPYNGLMEPRFG